MYEAQAQLSQNAAIANHIGYKGAALNTASTPKPTVMAEFVNRLQQQANELENILSCQKNLIERLHGPRPEKESTGVGKAVGGSILSIIDERFSYLSMLINDISHNQQVLNNLA